MYFLMIEAVLLGLVIGSFLNVCILRIPAEVSLGGRSVSPCCQKKIPWYQNIPLVSFIFLGGKCAFCGKKISLQYPLVEALAATLSVFTLIHEGYEPLPYLLWFVLFVSPLLVIIFIDFKHRIIPDVISIPGIAVGYLVTLHLHWPIWKEALLFSTIGMLTGGLPLLILAYLYEKIRKREGMGGGDIKFAAMLGAFLGWQGVIFVFMISSLLALLYGILFMVFNRKSEGPLAIPYGPFLALGALLFHFFGPSLLSFYWHAVL